MKFTADDGTISEDDITLTIEAAPILLIPGMFNNSAKTFGIYKDAGIWHQLTANNFTVKTWNYDGEIGPNEVLKRDFNSLYRTLRDIFNEYAQKGIACTRADIVAFGMGGLMARKFLTNERENSEDGNNWSIISYKQGMIRRVITVASPHRGTPWADNKFGELIAMLRNGLENTPFENKVAASIMRPFTMITNTVGQIFNQAAMSYVHKNSAWDELKTSSGRDYGFPSDVPMYAIWRYSGRWRH